MNTAIEITLLRHGRSGADDEQCMEGRYDSPLTEIGFEQARQRLANWQSQGRTFDYIVSSSLQRAHSVAKVMADGLNVALDVDAQWMEKDNGPLAGLPFAEADIKYPKADFVNPFEPYVAHAGTGESDIEMYARAALALQSVIRKGHRRNLVVSHGKFLNAVISSALGLRPQANIPHVIFALGDLGYIDLLYHPRRDIWEVRGLERSVVSI